MVTDEFPQSESLALIQQYRGSICHPVGAVGIILGTNTDLTLASFIDENFITSKDVTFVAENLEYYAEITTENARICYTDETEFSVISNLNIILHLKVVQLLLYRMSIYLLCHLVFIIYHLFI